MHGITCVCVVFVCLCVCSHAVDAPPEQEILDALFLHGGNLSVDDDVLIASADLIKSVYKYYRWKVSPERAGAL